jgi:hypothetical protein
MITNKANTGANPFYGEAQNPAPAAPAPVQAANPLIASTPPAGTVLPPGANVTPPAEPVAPVVLAPLGLDEIMRLMKAPLPNKDALKNISEGETPDAKRLNELQAAKDSKEIDYSAINFITQETFDRVQSDPEAMNKLFQQFASYVAKDTAEKIAFTQRSQQDYSQQSNDKLMNDMTTSQMIRDYLDRDNMKAVLPYQDYYIWKLNDNRDSGRHGSMDLQQLMVQTGKEVRAMVETPTDSNQQNTTPVFGGIGGNFQAQNANVKGNDWSNLMKDLTKNR